MKFMNLHYAIMNFPSSNLSNKITIIMNFVNSRRDGNAFAVRSLARTRPGEQVSRCCKGARLIQADAGPWHYSSKGEIAAHRQML